MGPCSLEFTPEDLKNQEIWSKAVCNNPWQLKYVPDYLKTQEMCIRVVEHEPRDLEYVPDHFKTRNVQRGCAQQATHAGFCSCLLHNAGNV